MDRPRRLRRTPALRALTREVHLHPSQFIHPIFVHERDTVTDIATMPGVQRHSIDSAVQQARDALALGVPSVILFGIPDHKDAVGTQAYADEGIIQRATRAIKAKFLRRRSGVVRRAQTGAYAGARFLEAGSATGGGGAVL